MKSLKKFLLLTAVIASSHATADVVLGTYRGDGDLNVQTIHGADNSVSGYDSKCKVAMNIDPSESDPQNLEISFSVYECGGTDFWNGEGALLKPEGSTYSYNEVKTETVTRQVPVYDYSCKLIGLDTAKFEVKRRADYSVQKLNESSYQIKQVWEQDVVQETYNRPGPGCSPVATFALGKQTKTVTATLWR